MPNDDREQERMDIHYHSLRMTMEDKLFIAPIEHPTAILDAGTGRLIAYPRLSSCTHRYHQALESGQWTRPTTTQLLL